MISLFIAGEGVVIGFCDDDEVLYEDYESKARAMRFKHSLVRYYRKIQREINYSECGNDSYGSRFCRHKKGK